MTIFVISLSGVLTTASIRQYREHTAGSYTAAVRVDSTTAAPADTTRLIPLPPLRWSVEPQIGLAMPTDQHRPGSGVLTGVTFHFSLIPIACLSDSHWHENNSIPTPMTLLEVSRYFAQT